MAFSLSTIFGTGSNPDDPYAPPINRKLIFIISGVLLAIILFVIVFAVISSLSSGQSNTFMTMMAKQQFINNTVTSNDVTSKIQNNALKKANIDAATLFGTDMLNLQDELTQQYGQTSISSDLLSAANDTNVGNELDNAALLGTFDTTYRSILSQKINAILATAPTIRNAVNDIGYQHVMDKYITDLKTINTELSEISF